MTRFEYESVDFDEVTEVDLIPYDSDEYQDFLSDIYDRGEEPQYKRWARKYPDTAERFKELAEKALDSPGTVVAEIVSAVFRSEERTCGDCWNARDDEYREGEEYIVCWENQPEPNSRRPRKLTTNSEFATECDQFSPKDEFAREQGVHPRLTSTWFLDQLTGDDGEDEKEKAALKYAFYQSWGLFDETDTERYGFSPNREWAMLDHLNSSADVERGDPGSGGREFEHQVRHYENTELGFPLRDTVFRITKESGYLSYKEMDLHTRAGQTPVIAELYTQRIASRKLNQLRDYEELYLRATGFEPEAFLVTDSVISWADDGEDGFKRVHLQEGESGQVPASRFFDRLRDLARIEEETVPLTEFIDEE